MNEHEIWQRDTSLRHFKNADENLPLQVRIAAAAAYVGAQPSQVDQWVKSGVLK